jgi:hypothetical protein
MRDRATGGMFSSEGTMSLRHPERSRGWRCELGVLKTKSLEAHMKIFFNFYLDVH